MTTPTIRHTFFCIDGHTAGNPVRLVAGGAPLLRGARLELPALKARKRPWPMAGWFRMDSARMLRAELPVQTKSTLRMGRSMVI